MLFARFLAENGLLIETQQNMAISLSEAEELAEEDGIDVWAFASRCAERMLPQIFRPDDPLLQISFATEHMIKLEKLLASLPQAVFVASDALGWVYQFWQSKKKEEVNRSEVKIGADEIAAVTQLFTEPYMVHFLLHNTLGAWWAGKKLTAEVASGANSEDDLRRILALPGVNWEYLRFVRGPGVKGDTWRPAAGTFDGWPKAAKEIRLLDPCCGSGHFLVAALHHLVPIRMSEEGLSEREAIDAVLRENLHGLEIDDRCCQIAAFAMAFAAWIYPNSGGYRQLPVLHLASTGIGPQSTEEQWVKLAEQSGMPTKPDLRQRVKGGLLNLHQLFSQARTLGSLIDPLKITGDVFAAGYETIRPYLAAILKVEQADNETRERIIAAAGMVKAAELLTQKYTLVITNVPYLGRGKQDDLLKEHLDAHFREGKADLATAFMIRCLDFCNNGGSIALVSPWGWTFATTYKSFREMLLKTRQFNFLPKLGEGGFGSTAAAGAFVVAPVITKIAAASGHEFAAIDASTAQSLDEKAGFLLSGNLKILNQRKQLSNPDSRILFDDIVNAELLYRYAKSYQGIKTGDDGFGKRFWWEFPHKNEKWRWFQSTVDETVNYGGCEFVLRWEKEGASIARLQGQGAWQKVGVAVSLMRELRSSIYTGEVFDSNVAVVALNDTRLAAPLWAYCSSQEFDRNVRIIDPRINAMTGSLVKVPFDLRHWQDVAAEQYPNGLPEPESNDPTQWLFHGYPSEAGNDTMLQVAVARLLGYHWPTELDSKIRLSKRAQLLASKCVELAQFSKNDGIICIPAVRGEEPASERLMAMLAACNIKPEGDLDEWLRNSFFQEHCCLFHDCPFVWHIWDGRWRDGFHALVNYHKLCEGAGRGRKLLESLTYSYLGEWITRQKDGVTRGEGGAEDRLVAAQELQKRLEAILAGEPPFDIFVRWKPLHKQPIGWEPDINDGVRINIRPFLATDLPNGRTGAGILRWKPNIKWGKDRGKEPERSKSEYPWFWNWNGETIDFMGGNKFNGNRWNDCHYTNKVKQTACQAAKGVNGD
jgi:hypothetical protein